MKHILLPLLFLVILFTTSCDNTVQMTSDWEETTIVYCLLNPEDAVSYIKVNKAFLGEGNALVMAAIRDSSEYGDGVSVSLEKYFNGKLVETIVFEPTEIDNKEDGDFYNPYQTVYAANTLGKIENVYNSDSSFLYKVVVKNLSGVIVSAETKVVGNELEVRKPVTPGDGRLAPISFINTSVGSTSIAFNPVDKGYLYKITGEFFFKEIIDGDTIDRSIKWNNMRSLTAGAINSSGYFEFSLRSSGFYTLVKDNVPYADATKENKVTKRRAGNFVLYFNIATEDYYHYSNLNVSGYNTDVVTYTNVNNGLGVVAARSKFAYTCQLAELTKVALYEADEYDYLKFVNW
jgi:hypothetical protein